MIQKAGKFGLAVGVAGTHPSRADAGEGRFGDRPVLDRARPFRLSVDTVLLAGILPADVAASLAAGCRSANPDCPARWSKRGRIGPLRRRSTTDDAVVRELFDKARFGLPGMVADNGVMNAGIFEYGGQWVRDTSNTLLGMVQAGHFELARRGFEHVLNNMITDDGRTMISGGFDDPDREQFDQMGELIHALKAYRDWTGDDSLLRRTSGEAAGDDRAAAAARVPRRHRHGPQPPRILGADLGRRLRTGLSNLRGAGAARRRRACRAAGRRGPRRSAGGPRPIERCTRCSRIPPARWWKTAG